MMIKEITTQYVVSERVPLASNQLGPRTIALREFVRGQERFGRVVAFETRVVSIGELVQDAQWYLEILAVIGPYEQEKA